MFGWLALDRRGEWRIRLSEANPASEANPTIEADPMSEADPLTEADLNAFERITSPALIEFIARNYDVDSRGRYFFQNGPQRVFVTLDYTPWVLRVSDDGSHLVTHTAARVRQPQAAWLDENGALLVSFELGVGEVLDRDLDLLTEAIRDATGAAIDGEWLVERVASGDRIEIRMLDVPMFMARIAVRDVPRRFRFEPQPAS